MSLVKAAIHAFEDAPLPDVVSRAAIRFPGRRRPAATDHGPDDAAASFARDMVARPIAEHTDAANAQHYELPAAFFEVVLGPNLKYSSGLYPNGRGDLARGEVEALRETEPTPTCRTANTFWNSAAAGARCRCGWLSASPIHDHLGLELGLPARLHRGPRRIARPDQPDRRHRRHERLRQTDQRFDRVVSVEMFEHMSNWRALLTRVNGWLKPDGLLFLHVFTHRNAPYRFDVNDPADWIAQYFFTGGVMPSHDLPRQFPDLFKVEADWRWSGEHYARTAEQWLENFDANRATIDPILAEVYGPDAIVWRRRWRLFFLATSGLFGHRDGEEWGVSHYRLRPVLQSANNA
jgi:cyclopropane-fatty-acyl-phospholipid synthase